MNTENRWENFYKNGMFFPTRIIWIGTDSFKDDNLEITATDFFDFAKSMHILEDHSSEDITVMLSTTGGDIYLAFAFYDIIKNSSCNVEVRAIGPCMSAGTIILQAADLRSAYPNSTFMMHSGEADISVPIDQVDNEAKEIKRISNKMKDIYMERMSIGKRKLETILSKDTFFSTDEALKLGLIDEVVQ